MGTIYNNLGLRPGLAGPSPSRTIGSASKRKGLRFASLFDLWVTKVCQTSWDDAWHRWHMLAPLFFGVLPSSERGAGWSGQEGNPWSREGQRSMFKVREGLHGHLEVTCWTTQSKQQTRDESETESEQKQRKTTNWNDSWSYLVN